MLNITIKEIMDSYNKLKPRDLKERDVSFAEASKNFSKQCTKESSKLNNYLSARLPSREIREKLGSLDLTKFKRLVDDRFYDPNVSDEILVIMASLLYLPKDHLFGDISLSDKIHHYITNLEAIACGQNGCAFRAGLQNEKGLFVIKAPKPKVDLTHELFVGLFGINSLRKFVPNFAYVYGGFSCSPLLLDSNNQLISWCQTGCPVNNIIYENISNSTSYESFIRKCTPEDFLNTYLQILYSLNIANREIDYTHYDLNGNNVLIKKLSSKTTIPYETENGREYFLTNNMAVIIDYEFSHFKYEQENYGSFGYKAWGINYDKSFPLYDAYKLLLILGEHSRLNKKVYDAIKQIFKFFNQKESFEFVLQKTANFPPEGGQFFLPYKEEYTKVNLLELTKFIRSLFKMSFITATPRTKILSCYRERHCMTNQEIIKELGLNRPAKPQSLFDFIDLLALYQKDKLKDKIKTLIEKFDYVNVVQGEVTFLWQLFANLDTSDIMEIQISKEKEQNIINDTKLEVSYMNYLYAMADLLTVYRKFRTQYQIINIANQIYQDPWTTQQLDQIAKGSELSFDEIMILKGYIIEDYKFISKLVKTANSSKVNKYYTILKILAQISQSQD